MSKLSMSGNQRRHRRLITALYESMIKGCTGCMRCVVFMSVAFFLSVGVASADCWVVARDRNGRELYECDTAMPQLPVCGSEYDIGGRCVIRRPRHRIPEQRRIQPVPPQNAQRPASNPTFNAGGSWPNRAKEYSQGRR